MVQHFVMLMWRGPSSPACEYSRGGIYVEAASSAAAKQNISSLQSAHTILVQCLNAALQRKRNQEWRG